MITAEHSGFCVKYTVSKTFDKGLGVFADEPVPQGRIVWRHVPGQYVLYDEHAFKSAIKNMPAKDVVYELTHAFGLQDLPGCLIRIHDAGALVNHSGDANLATNTRVALQTPLDTSSPTYLQDAAKALLEDRFTLIATRDIEAGEEFTNDYEAEVCDPPCYTALYQEFGVDEAYLEDN